VSKDTLTQTERLRGEAILRMMRRKHVTLEKLWRYAIPFESNPFRSTTWLSLSDFKQGIAGTKLRPLPDEADLRSLFVVMGGTLKHLGRIDHAAMQRAMGRAHGRSIPSRGSRAQPKGNVQSMKHWDNESCTWRHPEPRSEPFSSGSLPEKDSQKLHGARISGRAKTPVRGKRLSDDGSPPPPKSDMAHPSNRWNVRALQHALSMHLVFLCVFVHCAPCR
jgi:hypothetical protein